MGYKVSCVNSEFFISFKDFDIVIEKIRNMPDEFLIYDMFIKVHVPIHVDEFIGSEFRAQEDIGKIFEMWGWEVKKDESGNIIDVHMISEKQGEVDFELFKIIAPYVRKDSFLEFVGEDGKKWRWVFNGQDCLEKFPKVSWD